MVATTFAADTPLVVVTLTTRPEDASVLMALITVDFADARRRTLGRLFLEGNTDPVNTVLLGSHDGGRVRISRVEGFGLTRPRRAPFIP